MRLGCTTKAQRRCWSCAVQQSGCGGGSSHLQAPKHSQTLTHQLQRHRRRTRTAAWIPAEVCRRAVAPLLRDISSSAFLLMRGNCSLGFLNFCRKPRGGCAQVSRGRAAQRLHGRSAAHVQLRRSFMSPHPPRVSIILILSCCFPLRPD